MSEHRITRYGGQIRDGFDVSFVSTAELDALEAECERLRQQVKEINGAINAHVAGIQEPHTSDCRLCHIGADRDRLRALLNRAAAELYFGNNDTAENWMNDYAALDAMQKEED